jgi:glycosyltransferase involved in cell wall biosynthesis
MAAIYDVRELATAVKPWLLRTLLSGSDSVVYVDPDIEFFGSMDLVGDYAYQHGIVLTPHTRAAFPCDGCLPDDRMILQAGVYNLGFIGVGQSAAPFLDWWSERLARDCRVAVDQALFVDQRWIDFVPALFDHYVLRGPEYNVAYWNLHERDVRVDGDEYLVDGRPLVFFHYSGYDVEQPELLCRYTGDRSRILLSTRPDLARLCIHYRDRVMAAGYRRGGGPPYGLGCLPSGIELDKRMRRVYRDALLEAERSRSAPPPNPFTDELAFLAWLAEPQAGTIVSRYAYAVHAERADLQVVFPDIAGADAGRYLEWVEKFGRREERIPPAFVGGITLGQTAPEVVDGHRNRFSIEVTARPLPGINVVGYFAAELGVGEAARRLTLAIERAAIPHCTMVYRRTLSRQQHAFDGVDPNRAPYDMNLVCVNADQLPALRQDVGEAFFADRYTIGLWFWELSTFPPEQFPAFDLVDEIWVASPFVRDSLRRVTVKPVHVVSLPILPPVVQPMSRAQLGMSDRFTFLFSFDFLSVFDRKNPLAVVEAYVRAFAPDDGAALLLKSINGDRDLSSLERLRLRIGDRPDIALRDGYVAAAERDALVAACDCYVSLHRSEGYGLTMAEAMALAKPVIGTSYSGNLAYMTPDTSYLVPYTPVTLEDAADPYMPGMEWAEPDIGEAVRLMIHVFENQAEARSVGRRARSHVLTRHGVVHAAGEVARLVHRAREHAFAAPACRE